MKILIRKSEADGIVNAPSSKSAAHRMLICASMCRGVSQIDELPLCDDVLATVDCLRALGVGIELNGRSAGVSGIDFTKAIPSRVLNCRESGSTLRFLIPIAMLSGKEVVFTGSEKLLSRPMTVYEKLAKEYGLTFKNDGKKITVCGPLSTGEYFIDGNVSSQFITGMLLALSALDGDSKITVNGRIESRPYVDMTTSVMAKIGVNVCPDGDRSFIIPRDRERRCINGSVEGDWSGAAFLEAFNYLGNYNCVTVNNLDDESIQGDKICIEHFAALENGYTEIDLSNCPDLGPILFTVAAVNHGARFVGTKRLRDKESDRVAAMQKELSKFGAELIVTENSVTVNKRELHSPTEVLCGHNDHRVVMSLAVLCTLYGGEIDGAEAVSKSYPDFFEDIRKLGIKAYEV